jgi:hypothetical protein
MSDVVPGTTYSVEYEVNRIPKPSDYPFHCNTTKNAKNVCIHFDVHIGEGEPPSDLGRRADVYFDMTLFRVFAKVKIKGTDKWVEWSVDRLPHPFVPKYHLYFNPDKGYIWAHIDTIRDYHYSNPNEVYPGGKVGIQLSLQMPRVAKKRQLVATGQKRRNEKIVWMPSTIPSQMAGPRPPVQKSQPSSAARSSTTGRSSTSHSYNTVDNHIVSADDNQLQPRAVGEYASWTSASYSLSPSPPSTTCTILPSFASLTAMGPPFDVPEGSTQHMVCSLPVYRWMKAHNLTSPLRIPFEGRPYGLI